VVVVAHALDFGFAIVGEGGELVEEEVIAGVEASIGDGGYELVEIV